MRIPLTLGLSLALLGCSASQQQQMLRAERLLDVASDRWTAHVDQEIVKCQAKQLPTADERAECIAETKRVDDAVAPAVVAAVAALRAYWIAASTGTPADQRAEIVREFRTAVSDLPPEVFGGLPGVGGAR